MKHEQIEWKKGLLPKPVEYIVGSGGQTVSLHDNVDDNPGVSYVY